MYGQLQIKLHLRCFGLEEGIAIQICHASGHNGHGTEVNQLHSTHTLWFLGGKYSKKCDIYIETENDVFSIKLFGMPNRRTVLVLKDDDKFFIRRFFLMTYYISIVLWPINSKDKKIPSYDFKYGYKSEWNDKKFNKILLVNPVGMQFRYVSHRGMETTVRDGDIVNDMTVISLSQFLEKLKNSN